MQRLLQNKDIVAIASLPIGGIIGGTVANVYSKGDNITTGLGIVYGIGWMIYVPMTGLYLTSHSIGNLIRGR